MVRLAGTSYAGKQYDITYKVNGYLPDGSSERRVLKIAVVYGLETEVRICMDLVGMTPTEALAEWDLL